MLKKLIPVDMLEIGMYVIELDRPWLGTPFQYQGFQITTDGEIADLKKLCKNVFIDADPDLPTGDSRARGSSYQSLRGSVMRQEATPVEAELAVAKEIYSACEQSVQTSFESLSVTGELDPAPLMEATASMTRSIERNPDAMMLLFRIKQKGGTAFNRAVDTSILMITFGRFLQFPGERLERLGLAGLLLDVGMLALPDEILQKTNTLSEEEYEIAKSHVMHSVEIIRAASGLPEGLDEIVLQHHEREDGSGYPQGLSGRNISIDGAIAGLVDSYSAITSKRTFANQESPSNALNKLYKLRGKLFQDALVEQFIQCLGIYPVGSMVELNTGEIAIVIAQNLVRRLQPRVMVVLDRSLKPLQTQLILDLTKEPKASQDEPYRILRTLPRDKLPIDPSQFFLELTG
jgi:HD-GYP domain-containing protein (c-di-GMP phosphodiesterase class II)